MRLLYKPLGLLAGVLGGLVASAIFDRLWASLSGSSSRPEPTDHDRGWGEVATAAALQGAVFGGVKALVDRAGATGFAKATGVWPGREKSP